MAGLTQYTHLFAASTNEATEPGSSNPKCVRPFASSIFMHITRARCFDVGIMEHVGYTTSAKVRIEYI